MTESSFGSLTGIGDTEIPDVFQGVAETQDPAPTGGPLYSYLHDGKINGICVDQASTGLKIDRDALIESAFDLVREPHAEMLRITDSECADMAKYRGIMDDVYGGRSMIVTEERHYDPQGGCFCIWLQYDSVCYRLNPRYDYIRED